LRRSTPRNLALTPSGSHLFSANQNADRISIFARDAATGRLADTGRSIDVGTPMCVKIVR
jgi:6-phosphogluconolactonase